MYNINEFTEATKQMEQLHPVRPHRAATILKISAAACVIGISILEPHLPVSETLRNIIFWSTLGMGAVLALIGVSKTPNQDAYRCSGCGHIHVPDCNATLRSKRTLTCPQCKETGKHTYALPNAYIEYRNERRMKNQENTL